MCDNQSAQLESGTENHEAWQLVLQVVVAQMPFRECGGRAHLRFKNLASVEKQRGEMAADSVKFKEGVYNRYKSQNQKCPFGGGLFLL